MLSRLEVENLTLHAGTSLEELQNIMTAMPINAVIIGASLAAN